MADEVTAYQDAFSRLESADRNLSKFKSMLYDMTDALKRPLDISIAGNTAVGVRAVTQYNNKVLNLDSWPDKPRVETLISEWRTARADLEAKWSIVPKDRLSSLVSPERAPGGREHPNSR
jgi:hypothetical protein